MKSLTAILVLSFSLASFTLYTGLKSVNYKIDATSTMVIKGTSNVHDWVANVNKITGNANFSFSDDGMINIDNCNVSIDVNSIKSEKGSMMDKKIYKALKADTYSTITFKMKGLDSIKKTSTGFTAKVSGTLTIAGTSKPVVLDITGKALPNGSYEITGSEPLKMTTFNIDPPTAMMGAMTTGDDVTIEFKAVLNQN